MAIKILKIKGGKEGEQIKNRKKKEKGKRRSEK
jgi:hypothetical protein